MPKLDSAIRYARAIRRNLQRYGSWGPALGGACGLASIRLAIKLKDPKTLVLGDFIWDGREHPHAWNLIDGHIVDITATQFDCYAATKYPAIHVVHSRSRDARIYAQITRGLRAARRMDEWTYRGWRQLRETLATYS